MKVQCEIEPYTAAPEQSIDNEALKLESIMVLKTLVKSLPFICIEAYYG